MDPGGISGEKDFSGHPAERKSKIPGKVVSFSKFLLLLTESKPEILKLIVIESK